MPALSEFIVHRKDDPRHACFIVAFLRNGKVRVKWLDTGWEGNEYADDLVMPKGYDPNG